MDTPKIGWIGLGAMGAPMAQNLIKAGYDISVYNRTKAKEQELLNQGARSVETLSELIESTDLIFIMVSDDDAVRDVFKAKHGLMDAMAVGKIIVNMSTVSPEVSLEMNKLCEAGGKKYIDAPVSGSVKQALEASLVIMAGAHAKLFDEVKPVLEKLGKAVFNVGETGAGNKAKLAVNMFLAITTQGLAEMVAFANKMGIKKEDILEIIASGGLGSPYVKAKSKSILNNEFPSAFALKHMCKDLKLARDQHMDSMLGQVALETFDKATPTLGDEDIMAIIKQISK
jgi:3-hydroxyisobutyrate dehydrogenase